MTNQEMLNIAEGKRRAELRHLYTAIECLTEYMCHWEIERLHKALMYKGPVRDALKKALEAKYDVR